VPSVIVVIAFTIKVCSQMRGSLDCAYSRAGGGRMLVVDADSEEALRAWLAAAPDVPRDWTITALSDAVETIERYLASTE
jgi:hypothetical protein